VTGAGRAGLARRPVFVYNVTRTSPLVTRPMSEFAARAADSPWEVPSQAVEPRFGARKATAAFLAYVFAQFSVGFAVALGVASALISMGVRADDPALGDGVQRFGEIPMVLGSTLAGAAVAIAAALLWGRHLFGRRGLEGIGWQPASLRSAAAAAAAGLALGAVWVAAASFTSPVAGGAEGPLASMAARPGASRAVWYVVVLLLAPPVEEFFFRGFLLAGFVKRWGTAAGSVIVTALFVAMHLGETIHFAPAAVAITALAVATLLARIASGSLVPPVIIHFAYNLTIATAVTFGA
jgi:membrane protease YdiL (CAAX protease family)